MKIKYDKKIQGKCNLMKKSKKKIPNKININ